MKNPNPSPILPIIFSILIHCTSVRSDATLIEYTCKRTPNFTLCISSLYTYPNSATADVKGLALIMVKIVKAKATATLNRIRELLQTSPEIKQPLSDCAAKYNAILMADIPQAIEALNKVVFKFAQSGTDDAAFEAKLCEDNFNGKSPLTDFNCIVHDTSIIASAIFQILL